MKEPFQRTEMLLGAEAIDRLKNARVAVFGVGGVGGFAVEALARSGVGALDLIDKDVVDVTNLNRQVIALHSTVGRPKVEVAAERVRDIDPDCTVRTYQTFFLPETRDQFDFSQYDYVVDAIDTVTGKLLLIECAKAAGVPVISAMGAGNKLDPTAFRVVDLFDTRFDGLARVMRKECRRRGIDSLKVVWSPEEPLAPASAAPGTSTSAPSATEASTSAASSAPAASGASASAASSRTSASAASCQTSASAASTVPASSGASASAASTVPASSGASASAGAAPTPDPGRRSTPGSVAWVPSVAGLILAGEVIKDLIAE